ncbi:MAG: 23S rRNA (uracil(1939)-C(5))-methyltransferase RlmD [Betaproteobacteria bacterium]|nr:23S rRNA (uracil(1939)-C(5))-methyltransferase RlmD [Betaproteobacteria bacterium]
MPVGIVVALDHEARGIVRQDGKAVFVEGALPGETVEYASFRKKPNYEQARLIRIIRPVAERVAPRCPHFGVCGGCVMQHLDAAAQVAVKQRVLEDNLFHIGRVRAEEILPPIHGSPWGYRRKARLGVRKVAKKGGVLIGFREKRSSYIADLASCPILPPKVSALLLPLRALIDGLSVSERLPQVEVAAGDTCVALSLRILEPLTIDDKRKLRAFADKHHVVFYLQPGGPDSLLRFYPFEPPLAYNLPEFSLAMNFSPADFTQVNHDMNRALIRRALQLLDIQPGERVADLFCGLGNFTLPIARQRARVIGIEGNAALALRAEECARENGLADGFAETPRFVVSNLFECDSDFFSALAEKPEKLLIDPPREGAIAVVKALPEAGERPRRIVYVSCNPATLARDAGILVHQKTYRLAATGIVNMFSHTAHVESIALFVATDTASC